MRRRLAADKPDNQWSIALGVKNEGEVRFAVCRCTVRRRSIDGFHRSCFRAGFPGQSPGKRDRPQPGGRSRRLGGIEECQYRRGERQTDGLHRALPIRFRTAWNVQRQRSGGGLPEVRARKCRGDDGRRRHGERLLEGGRGVGDGRRHGRGFHGGVQYLHDDHDGTGIHAEGPPRPGAQSVHAGAAESGSDQPVLGRGPQAAVLHVVERRHGHWRPNGGQERATSGWHDAQHLGARLVQLAHGCGTRADDSAERPGFRVRLQRGRLHEPVNEIRHQRIPRQRLLLGPQSGLETRWRTASHATRM